MMIKFKNTTTYTLNNEDLLQYLNSPEGLGIVRQDVEDVKIKYLKTKGLLVLEVKHFPNETGI